MGRLDGKVAIITGAGGGQGREEAILFAKEGAKVVATDVNYEGAKETVEKIKNTDGQAIAIEHDVSTLSDWEKVVEKTISQFDAINVLVNNAGILGPQEPFEETTEETWDTTLGINAKGTFLGNQAVAEEMKKNNKGSIINISSVVGMFAVGDNAAYTASKGAVKAVTKQIGLELAEYNIRVNSIHPGIVETSMIPEDEFEDFKKMVPLNYFVDPKEIAYTALFLASDEAPSIHGAEIVVDGGITSMSE